MIANESTLDKRPNDTKINSYRSPYGLQQCAKRNQKCKTTQPSKIKRSNNKYEINKKRNMYHNNKQKKTISS